LERLQRGQGWSENPDSVYDEVFEMNTRGGDVDHKTVIRVFRLGLCAVRPLALIDVAEAVSLDENGVPNLDPKYILRITRNLLMEDEKSHIIHFCHLSAAEYVWNKKSGDYGIFALPKCHALMAEVFLKLLPAPKRQVQSGGDVKLRGEVFEISGKLEDLVSYACVLWLFHRKFADDCLLTNTHLRKSFSAF
jgi:hypothetical protein